MKISEFRTRRRVEFADTDMAGIVHFARFFVYMESAEHEMLRSLIGDEPHFMHEGRQIGWPRARASCHFVSPARLGDVVEIRVAIQRKGRRSLTYRFELSCGERRIAEGEITAICCVMNDPPMRSIDIPAFLADQLEEAPPSGAAPDPPPEPAPWTASRSQA